MLDIILSPVGLPKMSLMLRSKTPSLSPFDGVFLLGVAL